MSNNTLCSGNPPTEKGKVTLSFLGEKYLAGSMIDLGIHLLDKTKIVNHNVNYDSYNDINKYTFIKDGFQTVTFDEETLSLLNPIYNYSYDLKPDEPGPTDEDIEIQNCIDILQEWIKNKYTELTGDSDIICICSRHLIMRIAGCNKDSCQIPGNPLMHLDYLSFKNAYERQCEEQEYHPIPVVCPDISELIDVVNIWFPSKCVKDWPLGFIDINNVEIADYVPIELVVGSKAASLRYKPNLRVIYKNNMKPSEVYMFRSATNETDDTQRGVVHGSFRITQENIPRHSIELRCCIFRKKLLGGRNIRKKKKNRKKTCKKYTSRQ